MPDAHQDSHDTFVSPLAARNAGPEMLKLLSARHRIGLWRRLWIALAKHERELGIERISADAITQMEAAKDDIDFDRAAEFEKKLRHDVMAHVHTFEEAAPAAKGIIHLGATSQYVVDNAELIILRGALRHVAQQLASVVAALGDFALEWKDLPTLGYTHYQPAQLTTVGKRATLWAQDFADDLAEIEHRIDALQFRGVKGTTGTQASFLSLFNGDGDKVDELDRRVTAEFGFEKSFVVTGQTYPRKVDHRIAADLGGIAASVHKFANDIRLLANLKQVEEPFETSQIGSSAMAYKRNPMRCERATGLARFVISLMDSPFQTAAEQWMERTLDDSSNKRLALPEMLLAIDGCLRIVLNVARGMAVYPATVTRYVHDELPFMATEDILMAAVQQGGDRQELHEKIRQHSMAAAEQVKQHGKPNDLLDRLCGDAAFAGVDLANVMDPSKYIGRAPLQTQRFVEQVVQPIRDRYEIKHDADLNV